MKATIDKNNYKSHFIGFLFILMALCDVLQSRNLMAASAILSIGTFIFCFSTNDRNFYKESILFIIFLFTSSLINLFFTQNNFGGSLALTGHLFLTFIYLQADPKKLTPWVVLSYTITIGFIAYNIFILNTPANDIYEGLSRNHAGFAVVFWTIFLLFHLKITYNRLLLLPPLIGLILTFFLFGRTSIIVSALLLLIVFFYKFKSNTKILGIATILFLGICYYLWLKFGSILITETNFAKGTDTPRWKLWSIYFENLNFTNLFTGIDVSKLPMYDQFSGNPHNSFIKFHSRTGLGAIALIVLYFVSAFQYIRVKQFYILSLLLLLTLRAFFDGDILVGNFDFIFFIVTFYWIKNE